MPVNPTMSSEIANAYLTTWTTPFPDSRIKAQSLAAAMAPAIVNGFSTLLVNANITGAIPIPPPGVPIPYAAVENLPVTINAGILQSSLATLFQAWDATISNPAFAANLEAQIIADAIYQAFVAFIPVLLVHGAQPLVITVPPSFVMSSVISVTLLSTYLIPGAAGSEAAKATAIGGAILAAVVTWVAAMTVSGAVITAPVSPLAGGLATGLVI